jgi:hypothetical protein
MSPLQNLMAPEDLLRVEPGCGVAPTELLALGVDSGLSRP